MQYNFQSPIFINDDGPMIGQTMSARVGNTFSYDQLKPKQRIKNFKSLSAVPSPMSGL